MPVSPLRRARTNNNNNSVAVVHNKPQHCVLEIMDIADDDDEVTKYWSDIDVDYGLAPEDDFLQQLSNDLEIPMLLEGCPQHHMLHDGCMSSDLLEPYACLEEMEDDDPMQWGPGAFPNLTTLPEGAECQIKEEIKMEPVSPRGHLPPSPSPSSSSSESWHSGDSSEAKFVLETPPISPPQTQDGSPPTSPHPLKSTVIVSPVKILPSINVGTNSKIVIAPQTLQSAKRIKIQPKPEPGIGTAVPTITLPKRKEESRTIVLTAQDFAALTQQVKTQCNGTNGRIRPVGQLQPSIKQEPAAVAGNNNNNVPLLDSPSVGATMTPASTGAAPIKCVAPVRQEFEIKAIKRQQRMIKNRESACLSRKKKKEYVTSLENQILDLQQENSHLKMENHVLKERLSKFEENIPTRRHGGVLSGNPKKTTAFLAVLFMVSLNLGSLGGIFNRESVDPVIAFSSAPTQKEPNFRHGRSLLWSEPSRTDIPSNIDSNYRDVHRMTNKSVLHPTCPLSINQTESLRLDSELRRWIGVERDTDNVTKQDSGNVVPTGEVSLHLPVTKLPIHKPKRKQRNIRRPPVPSNEVELYGSRPHHYEYAAFFDAIHRRDDTFYVVSFSGNHLLLPALAHNKTLRPKMSLMLPALPINESMSAPPHHVTMMQIDCEVINTQLVHVKEVDIPAHLRRPNDTSRYPNATGTAEKQGPKAAGHRFHSQQRPYRPYFVKANPTADFESGEFGNEVKLDEEFNGVPKVDPFKLKDFISKNLTQPGKKFVRRKTAGGFP